MESVKEKQKNSYNALKEKLGLTNPMAAIRVTKVLVSSGTGKHSRADKTKNGFVAERLAKIAGQKTSPRPAKVSVASFKVREGEVIGHMVTLRGQRMYDFLDRFFNIAIPRVRDFRGFATTSVDDMGNVTLGIREHNIFPETAEEELKDVFGLSVTLVKNAKNREDAVTFLEYLGVPFKKVNKE